MSITFQSRRPPLDPEEVATIESRLRVRLPNEYRDFLMAYNVAVPEQNQYVSSTATTSVECFFGISDIVMDDLFAQNQTIYRGRLPNGVLAIARAGGGDLICLNLLNGSIYFWDHENEATNEEVPGFANMTALAASLSVFLRTLQPRTMEPPAGAKVKSVQLKPGFAEKFKKFM
jgi:hypothetical protein